MPKSILVCAAHPDDEVLGCGGTIARHVTEGNKVNVVYLADGVSSRAVDNEQILLRHEAAIRAQKVLGIQGIPVFYDYPDQKLDTIHLLKLVQSIEHVCHPNIVYTHHLGDLNADHRRVTEAALIAFRPLPGSTVEAIYGFETLSSTEWASEEIFVPTRFVAIDLEKKLAALKEYQSEMRDFPHPRSYDGVRALAMLRGMTVGLPTAEAFTVLREIIA